MAGFCGRHGYSGRTRPELLVERLRTNLLGASTGTTSGKAFTVLLFADQLELLNTQIRAVSKRIGELLLTHPDAAIFLSFPGLGHITAATMLAEMGEDRGRFPTADVLLAETGTAPVTRSSGRSHTVRFRYAANKRMRHAIDWWTFVSVRENDWAHQAYERARAPRPATQPGATRPSAPDGSASCGAAGPTDLNSSIGLGGNKMRKLDYLVADALAQGCDTLVSIGGVQSNHTRQVAAVAARAGLRCVLVQESCVDWPDAVYDKVGNILISRLAGADVRLVKAGFGIGFKESWEQALREIEDRGGKSYAILAGGSDHPLGGHGFAGWAQELAEQEAELGVFLDTVVVCSVTGSTQAGMVAGFSLLEEQGARHRRVLGIDASAKPTDTREAVLRIAHQTARAIGLKRELASQDVELDERYHGGVYGIPDDVALRAMRLAAQTEGMITDPAYEGKSTAAVIDLIGRREIPAHETVLFAHLGGQPALNGYGALFS